MGGGMMGYGSGPAMMQEMMRHHMMTMHGGKTQGQGSGMHGGMRGGMGGMHGEE